MIFSFTVIASINTSHWLVESMGFDHS